MIHSRADITARGERTSKQCHFCFKHSARLVVSYLYRQLLHHLWLAGCSSISKGFMSLSRTSLPFQCPSNHLFFLPFVVISLMFLLFSSIAWFRLLFFLFRSLHIIVSSVFILLVMKQQFQLLFYCRVFISVPLCPLQSVSCFISPLKPLSMCSFFFFSVYNSM